MTSTAKTADEYLSSLPADRQEVIAALRTAILQNLPKGFQETMSYGMITYVVPHERYPAGYHCDPKQALPFISLASQKNHIAYYHMGIYSDPDLYNWYLDAYTKRTGKKPDMGKSCLRFTPKSAIPFDLLGELTSKVTVDEWISKYEANYLKPARKK